MAESIARLEDVSRTYRSGPLAVEALRGVSLDVLRGDYVAVTGPSGSGKFTFCLLYTSDAADELT